MPGCPPRARLRLSPAPASAIASAPAAASAPHLVAPDREDEHEADGDVLPVGLDADDHEAVLEHRGIHTPMTEPMIVATPPNRLVPPIATAVIACRLSVECPDTDVVVK